MNVLKTVEVINDGGLVLGPTDTVYGIQGDALNIDAVKKVLIAKQRDVNKSLIVLVGNKEILNKCVDNISELENRLIEKYWPGKLTIIFKKSELINDLVSGGRDTIAIRMPGNKELLEVLTRINKPVFSTSANISNQKTITNVKDIDEELSKYMDFIDDGGEIINSSSTIIQVIDNKIKILRGGELEDIIREDFKDFIL